MTYVRIKSGAVVIELTEGDIIPTVARLQSSVVIEAERFGDDQDGYVYQFIYHDRQWTIGAEDVEVLS